MTVVPGASTLATSDIVDERPRLSARVGRWSTDLRPPVPGVPSLGWNSTTNAFEFYNGSTWANLVPTWSTLAGKPSFSTLDGRTIFVNDLAPTAGQGANGDIWLEY